MQNEETAPGVCGHSPGGAKDDQFYADKFAAIFAEGKPPISVTIVPEIDHIGLILDKSTVAAAVKLVKQVAP
ncbi:MAG: hypothetical protein ORN98_06550 [Alphaproteobacteria bacterium]|nr:hypothetical protein [Alphaproteobacteria bacterium]